VAAIEATLALRALAEERVSLSLLAPDRELVYRPLAVAEPFGNGRTLRFPLAEVAAAARAELLSGALAKVDPDRRLAWTRDGAELRYDVLLLACGARRRESLAGALTFRDDSAVPAFRNLLADARDGVARRLAFAVPGGQTWPLPLYELALLTAAHLAEHGVDGAELTLVTPEEEPLGVFGRTVVADVRELLGSSGIRLVTARHSARIDHGHLVLVPEGKLAVDRVVTLPLLKGPRLAGIPRTDDGFVPVDEHGLVEGLEDVYAAGDMTAFPLKQGGLAAQQADAAAQAIAARAGAAIEPEPFRPVLRGLLLTGGVPRYLRSRIEGGHGDTSEATADPLWWPPAKIVGRHLASYLAARP
jgi:sulfide:quinone oxidoreductase